MEGKRGKRRLWPWLVVIAVLAGLAAYNYWPSEPDKIIISRETTYILGPLNPDGTPNYVKYLDDKCAEGVTAENNAAPLLLRAFGPEILPAEIRAEALRRLNLPADMFDGNDAAYFTQWRDRAGWAKADANGAGDANSSAFRERERNEPADNTSLGDVRQMLLAGKVHPEFEGWLAGNAGPLELVRQAVAKDRFYLPLISTSNPPKMADAQFVQSLGVLQDIAMALAARAVLKMTRDDRLGAWDDVLAIHRMAHLLGQMPMLVCQLVAFRVDEIAATAGIVLATYWPMDATLARDILAKLNNFGPASDVVKSCDEYERFDFLDAAVGVSRGQTAILVAEPSAECGAVGCFVRVNPNQILRETNSWLDRLIKPMRLPSSKERAEAFKAIDAEFKELAARAGRRATNLRVSLLKLGGRLSQSAMTNVISDMFVCWHLCSFAPFSEMEGHAKMTFEIEKLAIALACFHAEQGRWPGQLKELCPSLLKAIPADRFSEKPLIYRPSEKGYLLYSVGRNLRDDGGQCKRTVGGKVVNAGADDIAAEVKPVESASTPAEAASRPAASQP